MNLPIAIALLFAAADQSQDAGQPFRLEPGDFRWVPFTVRQTPSEVDCRFEVVRGNPSVHVELLPMSEFRLFSRGREHDTMALTPDGRSGEFKRIIDVRGRRQLRSTCRRTSIQARMWRERFRPKEGSQSCCSASLFFS